MVNSREKFKDYFLKIYLVWALIIPISMILVNSYLTKEADQSIWEGIAWSRVPAILALFGLIWPLTIVISPAFFQSVTVSTGLTFFEALGQIGTSEANTTVIVTIILVVVWVGPVIHFVTNLLKHKAFINSQSEKTIDWYDYIAGFI